jgi:hypothetical protein
MSLAQLRSSTGAAGEELTDAAATLSRMSLADHALPADAPGRLGELAHALHAQLTAALSARAREAAAHAARFADAAEVLRLVAAGYADTDAEARRRHQDGES